MSFKTFSQKKSVRRSVKGVGAAAVLAGVAYVLVVPSGALFSSGLAIDGLTVNAAHTGVDFPGGSSLVFDNLQPTVPASQTFNVRNTGSINEDAVIGQPLVSASANAAYSNLSTADQNLLMERVQGNGVDTGWVQANGQATLPLGTLGVNQIATYTVSFRIDDSATVNDWQGVSITSKPTVTVTQHDHQ